MTNELLEKIDKLQKELSDAKEYCDYSIINREQLTKQRNYWMDKSDKLEKKLDIAVSVLKRYEMPDEFEGGVGSDYEDMMWTCTEALKQIKEVK